MSIFWRSTQSWRAVAIVCSLGLHNAAFGVEAWQPLEAITATAIAAGEERAKLHGHNNISVEVRPLDKRLRLPRCDEPLNGVIPQTSQALGAISVRIECATPKPWSIYVRAKVIAQRAVPVLTRPLARNATVSAADIRLVNMPVESVSNGIIFDPQQIIGMEVVRSLDADSTIRINQLRAPTVVKRGQLVTLIAGAGGLEVKIQGKAMGDAVEGERVSVSNLSSGKKVEGTANSDGTVTVR